MEKKEFVFDDGFKVIGPARSCLFCKHCTDVFYDYTSGPYMFMCDKMLDTPQVNSYCFEEDE